MKRLVPTFREGILLVFCILFICGMISAQDTTLAPAQGFDAQMYRLKGSAKVQFGDYQGAIEDFTKAIRKDEDYFEAYNDRGFAKMKMLDYEDAIADFDKAIDLNPKSYSAWYNRGASKYITGKKENACFDLEKSFKLGSEKAKKTMQEYGCNDK